MADDKPTNSGSLWVEEEKQEGTISLKEFIEAERDLEDDARAVLGGSDTNTCTYSQGYVQRQALYSCATCKDEDGSPAGVCLACSLDCHDGHNLFELYTKRFFRCDCGNSKFKMDCQLQKDKDSCNPQNKYDQNFEGLYCSCNRPYPDPDNEDEGEMIQCCMCEDWYHDNHLEMEDDIPSEYEEMICVHCVKRYTFLLNYRSNAVNETVTVTKGDEGKEVDITSTCTEDNSCITDPSSSQTSDILPAVSTDTSSPSEPASCSHLTAYPAADCVTLFMSADWRQQLCTCTHCKLHYKTHNIEYLLDSDDPTHVYEQKAKNSGDSASSYEKGMDALSNLGRVQQIELLTGYNDMKSSLSDYLKSFASNDKVVQAKDIEKFFEEYSQNKRRRLAVPPSSCS